MPTFFIWKGKAKISVKADEILYFQADGKYTVIAMKDGEQYMASKCLSCFEQLLPADQTKKLKIHLTSGVG
jgi:DNA-binding LytR/AlgR family response regulator